MIFYNGKVYPFSMVIIIGKYGDKGPQLSMLDFSLTERSEILLNHHYLCANFPFSGIGESGSLQSVKNALVFELGGTSVFYTVKNTNEEKNNCLKIECLTRVH
ncbi:hypothetical protein ACT5AM_004308 [Cronobacter malonaticus]